MLHQFSDIQCTHTIKFPSQQLNQFQQSHQSQSSELCLQSSSSSSIVNTSPMQQKQYESYFKTLLKQQLKQDSDFCKIIGQKMLQILFIKIVNQKIGNKSSIMRTSLMTLQKNIYNNFLKTQEEINQCLKQQKISMIIGTLFLNQDYKHLEIIQKQLSVFIQQNKNGFSEIPSPNKQLPASQSSQIKQKNMTFKKQQKRLSSIAGKELSPIKPGLDQVNKFKISNDSKKSQNVKQQQPFNKFAQFLNEPKYENDRKKPTNNYLKQNLIKGNNYQKYNKGGFYRRKKQKYISKDEVFYDRRAQIAQQNPYPYYYQYNGIYPFYYEHGNNYQPCNYIQSTNYYQYQHLDPFYHNYNYNQYQHIPSQYQQLQLQHQCKSQYSKQVQQNADPIQQPELTSSQEIKNFEQKFKQVQIPKIMDSKRQEQNDLFQLIKQITSKSNFEQVNQCSISLQSSIEDQNIFNEPGSLKNKSQNTNDNNNISPQHKRNIQQYLIKLKNTRSQINILCQQFGIKFPNFQRKMIDNKFFVEGTLEFQSIYLNKQKIKIRAQGLAKNTKQATQIVSKKILRIIYQNIQQMWRDFVKIKEKKGLKL